MFLNLTAIQQKHIWFESKWPLIHPVLSPLQFLKQWSGNVSHLCPLKNLMGKPAAGWPEDGSRPGWDKRETVEQLMGLHAKQSDLNMFLTSSNMHVTVPHLGSLFASWDRLIMNGGHLVQWRASKFATGWRPHQLQCAFNWKEFKDLKLLHECFTV